MKKKVKLNVQLLVIDPENDFCWPGIDLSKLEVKETETLIYHIPSDIIAQGALFVKGADKDMDIKKRADGYWITNMPDGPDCGPYDRKADADDDRRGMMRFFKHEHEWDFFTVERRPDRKAATDCDDAPTANR